MTGRKVEFLISNDGKWISCKAFPHYGTFQSRDKKPVDVHIKLSDIVYYSNCGGKNTFIALSSGEGMVVLIPYEKMISIMLS